MQSGPLGSLVINTFSARACIITGSIIGTVGLGLSSFAADIYTLYFTYGLLGGISRIAIT
jgi:hypothetical protein